MKNEEKLLTENLNRQLLDGSLAGSVGATLDGSWRVGENLTQDLKISKALTSELSLDLDTLPALEAVCRRPVTEEFAVGVGNGRLELGLNHVETPWFGGG